MNTFGTLFRLTTFGESHGPGIGGIIDGMPAGIPVDLDFIQSELNRRKPGQSALTTPRKENDCVELLSGVFDGRTTGCPIGFLVRNENQHSADYDNMRHVFRPSHADFTYETKYGIRDHRGGGRSSARETIARVVGGAFAKMVLKEKGIRITAFTQQVGWIAADKDYATYDFAEIERNPVRCPDAEKAAEMGKLIAEVKAEGDTIGGIIACVIQGCPVGLGEPVLTNCMRNSERLCSASTQLKALNMARALRALQTGEVLKTITSFPTETEALPLLPTTAEAYKGASATGATFTSA